MGQGLCRLARSRRVQLTPIPQQMASNLQRQSSSAWLVERRSYCDGAGGGRWAGRAFRTYVSQMVVKLTCVAH